MTESSRKDDQQHQSADKESTSVIKRWIEPVSLPKTQRSMDRNHAELPHKTSTPSKLISRIIKQTVVEPNPWIPVEQQQWSVKTQQTEFAMPTRSSKSFEEQPKCIQKQPEQLNYKMFGGSLAALLETVQTEGPLVEDLTIQHIANHCSVFLALYGIDCEVDCALSVETINCFQKLNELMPHQFAQVFKAAKKKNPDILSYDEAMCDYKNLKDWLAAALKEIKQLEGKGVWTECHKLEAGNEQIVPCTWVFR